MKKKLLGVLCFAMAAAALIGGAREGGSGIIGGGAGALVFIFLGLKCFGVIKSRAKKTADPDVWTTSGSDKYHIRPGCQHISGKELIRMSKSDAIINLANKYCIFVTDVI